MGTIYIDADACSVKAETYKVAVRYNWPVRVVANQYIQTPRTPLIVCIMVGQGADVADDWIADRSAPGDVVITNDIPLASRCLDKGARVLGQKGHEFTPESIGDALAGRELSQNLREMGVMTGGPRPMAQKDRSRFLGKLDEILVDLDRVQT
ncbi:MAG: YaiI/YqxD family protein [Myxococcota bacterium]|nr:YaiI/YqxD family protein [Myxococcota bacterium]